MKWPAFSTHYKMQERFQMQYITMQNCRQSVVVNKLTFCYGYFNMIHEGSSIHAFFICLFELKILVNRAAVKIS